MGRALKTLFDALQKALDLRIVAFEKVPLADLAAGDQAGALQGGEVGRHRGLGEPGKAVDLAGAYASFQRVVLLLGEVALALLEPAPDVPAHRVRQGLDDVVQIVAHGIGARNGVSRWGELKSGLRRDWAESFGPKG